MKIAQIDTRNALRAMKTCSDGDGALCGPTQLREIDQVTARHPPSCATPGRPPKPARARPRLAQRACGAVRARCALSRAAPTESAMGLECAQERYCPLWEPLPRVQEDLSCPCPACTCTQGRQPILHEYPRLPSLLLVACTGSVCTQAVSSSKTP